MASTAERVTGGDAALRDRLTELWETPRTLRGWLTTVDHKTLGKRYVYTAFVSTGIPNIETYMAVPPKTIARLRWMRHIQPLLALRPVQSFMKRRVLAATPGPSEQRRRDSGCHVWGEVRNVAGNQAGLELETPNGYELTVTASLGIAEYLLGRTSPPAGGYFTPSQLMGADYVLKLPGVRLIEPGNVAVSA